MFNIKDIHKGETCYIFGPSIKWFNDHIGTIPFHNDFKKLNVKYSVLIQPSFFSPLTIST